MSILTLIDFVSKFAYNNPQYFAYLSVTPPKKIYKPLRTEKLLNRTFNISLNEGIKHEQCYKLQRSRNKIIIIRGQKVILDSDVAKLS